MSSSISASVVKFLEEKKGLSLREIAQIVDVHASEVSRIKAGNRKWTMSQMERLADDYRISLSVLLLDAVRDLNNHDLNAELRYYLDKARKELDKA